MTGQSLAFLSVFAVVAVIDWWAVLTERVEVENVAKPLVMIVLVAMVLGAAPAGVAAAMAVVVALVLSLIGDVLLLPRVDRFVEGLAAFLAAHVAYVVALAAGFDLSASRGVIGLALMIGIGATVGRRIVSGAGARDRRLVLPVAAYVAVIGMMAATAVATGELVAIVGAVLFVVSDAVLGWNRFVARLARGRIIVMSTYHLGQAGLALAVVAA